MDELMPNDLHATARELQVHPFEVVRLQVLSGAPLDQLAFDDPSIGRLREFGRLETWWEDGADALPEDDNASRRVVRGMLDAMVQREHVGEKTTRLDNLWRGLPADHVEVAEQAVMVMHELGMLASVATPAGMQVAVHPDALENVKDVVARGNAPDALAAIWSE